MKYTGFPMKVRAIITERARGFCEVCGFDAHRRTHGRDHATQPGWLEDR